MRHAHGPHVCETLPALTRVAPIYRYYCKCMLSHDDHVFAGPDWILEKGSTHSTHSSLHTHQHRLIVIRRIRGLACGHTGTFAKHGNGLGSARVPRSLPHIW